MADKEESSIRVLPLGNDCLRFRYEMLNLEPCPSWTLRKCLSTGKYFQENIGDWKNCGYAWQNYSVPILQTSRCMPHKKEGRFNHYHINFINMYTSLSCDTIKRESVTAIFIDHVLEGGMLFLPYQCYHSIYSFHLTFFFSCMQYESST